MSDQAVFSEILSIFTLGIRVIYIFADGGNSDPNFAAREKREQEIGETITALEWELITTEMNILIHTV